MGPSGQWATCSGALSGSLLEGAESDTKFAFKYLSKDILKTDLIIELCHIAMQCENGENCNLLGSYYMQN